MYFRVTASSCIYSSSWIAGVHHLYVRSSCRPCEQRRENTFYPNFNHQRNPPAHQEETYR